MVKDKKVIYKNFYWKRRDKTEKIIGVAGCCVLALALVLLSSFGTFSSKVYGYWVDKVSSDWELPAQRSLQVTLVNTLPPLEEIEEEILEATVENLDEEGAEQEENIAGNNQDKEDPVLEGSGGKQGAGDSAGGSQQESTEKEDKESISPSGEHKDPEGGAETNDNGQGAEGSSSSETDHNKGTGGESTEGNGQSSGSDNKESNGDSSGSSNKESSGDSSGGGNKESNGDSSGSGSKESSGGSSGSSSVSSGDTNGD